MISKLENVLESDMQCFYADIVGRIGVAKVSRTANDHICRLKNEQNITWSRYDLSGTNQIKGFALQIDMFQTSSGTRTL